jgi:acetyl esterase/lipase
MKIINKLLLLVIAATGMFTSCNLTRNFFVEKMLSSWEKQDGKILSGQTFPEGVIEIVDIPYIDDGHDGHLLDIYYPADKEGPFPVIVDIHGGGFIYGSKELNKSYNYHLAKNGFILFNINYRLAFNDTKVPGQIQDIIGALNWINSNIELYPANKEKIYIMGESAGAYLAAMTAVVLESPRLQDIFDVPNVDIDIDALALVSGLMELEHKSIGYWGMRSVCLEKGYKKQEYYQNMMLKNIPEIENLPPVFMTTNGDDGLDFMTLDFEELLKENDLEYEFYFIPKNKRKKLGHVFNVSYPEWDESIALNNAMLEYLMDN